ncbi:DUF4405 domain-containing protein [Erysipelotrichaceae bacterium HCN-30851]
MKLKVQRIIDVIMFLLLLMDMAFFFTGQVIHEIIGTFTIICFLLHHFLNKNWYRNLVKKYTLTKLVMNILNILLLVDMIVLLVSGIMISHTVFTFIPALGSIATARQLYMIASYWCFVLVSCHIGLHWNMLLISLKKKGNFFHLSLQKLFIRLYRL